MTIIGLKKKEFDTGFLGMEYVGSDEPDTVTPDVWVCGCKKTYVTGIITYPAPFTFVDCSAGFVFASINIYRNSGSSAIGIGMDYNGLLKGGRSFNANTAFTVHNFVNFTYDIKGQVIPHPKAVSGRVKIYCQTNDGSIHYKMLLLTND